jgi:large subunit ribosomal protein L24
MGLKALKENRLATAKVQHVKKNDRVVVVAGSKKGTQSRIIEVKPEVGKVRVEGVAVVKRHAKPNPTRGVQGGIFEKEAFIDASNVMLLCPNCGKSTRVSHTEQADGHRVRSCKKCGGLIDKR